jgi:UDP:flavonoid glycosyltransferase YjiC (YdhE family)
VHSSLLATRLSILALVYVVIASKASKRSRRKLKQALSKRMGVAESSKQASKQALGS